MDKISITERSVSDTTPKEVAKDTPVATPKSDSSSSHHFANQANWWLDFWTMTGRKSENQDSLLILNCIMGKHWD